MQVWIEVSDRGIEMKNLKECCWIAGGVILFLALYPNLNLAVVTGSVNSYQVDMVADGMVCAWMHEK